MTRTAHRPAHRTAPAATNPATTSPAATSKAPPSEAPPSPTLETSYREALREGIREAMARDDRVFLMGEDVGRYGGSFGVSKGLLDQFGPDRIRDTPLSESAFVGMGIGAALNGLRVLPVVERRVIVPALPALGGLRRAHPSRCPTVAKSIAFWISLKPGPASWAACA